MIAIDLASLSAPAQRIVQPGTPEKMQLLAARGIAPGIRPGEMIAVLVVLCDSERGEVKKTAEKTLSALPEPLLTGAISSPLHPAAIDALSRHYSDRPDVLRTLLSMPDVDGETVCELARVASEAVAEIIATNEERLLANPRVIELLYMNKNTRMSTADRITELAARQGLSLDGIPAWNEAKEAIQNELIPEPTDEPTPDDLLFTEVDQIAREIEIAREHGEDDVFVAAAADEDQEVAVERVLPLYARITNMTVTQKIRCAMLGSRDARLLLVRDRNKIVATAAVRSPLLQEPDVVLIAKSRNVPDEVLRILATTAQWAKSYSVKRSLVENPKTPVAESTKMIPHLREHDLKALAKSKNVTTPVRDAARRHLSRRST